nr:MAG TPA: Putative antitoxin of bacterial toxin-antitoxin system, YdaS/YdaT [Caudoviricetes sp.]
MDDRKIIISLGGPTKIAKILGCSPQRVQNWIYRGIPARVKLEYPELFQVRASRPSR